MGILAQRAPLLAKLGAGVLRVEEAAGGKRRLFVAGGFAQMVDDKLTILTEEALEPEKITAERSRRAPSPRPRSSRTRTEAEHQRRAQATVRARALGPPRQRPEGRRPPVAARSLPRELGRRSVRLGVRRRSSPRRRDEDAARGDLEPSGAPSAPPPAPILRTAAALVRLGPASCPRRRCSRRPPSASAREAGVTAALVGGHPRSAARSKAWRSSRQHRRRGRRRALGAWAMRVQGNLSLVAVAALRGCCSGSTARASCPASGCCCSATTSSRSAASPSRRCASPGSSIRSAGRRRSGPGRTPALRRWPWRPRSATSGSAGGSGRASGRRESAEVRRPANRRTALVGARAAETGRRASGPRARAGRAARASARSASAPSQRSAV